MDAVRRWGWLRFLHSTHASRARKWNWRCGCWRAGETAPAGPRLRSLSRCGLAWGISIVALPWLFSCEWRDERRTHAVHAEPAG